MDFLLTARMKYARSVKIKRERERMSSSSRFAVQSTCIVCVLLGGSRQTEAISSFRRNGWKKWIGIWRRRKEEMNRGWIGFRNGLWVWVKWP
nr:hypothetical protein Iba_chr09dCG10470 [Ipomoea batatas]GMD42215.1 hypothetical protein Iba_chr10bCG7210 [Ipomoea batatas]GMD43737.1 hypothetical protein Iba_chr10cCG8200 [Ipomoea batatas]GMD48114.1 hypothetical protein Iba_chr10fCG3310 [Ipomoea batatas]